MKNEYRALETWANSSSAASNTRSVVYENWLRSVHGPHYDSLEDDRHDDYPRWMRERDQEV